MIAQLVLMLNLSEIKKKFHHQHHVVRICGTWTSRNFLEASTVNLIAYRSGHISHENIYAQLHHTRFWLKQNIYSINYFLPRACFIPFSLSLLINVTQLIKTPQTSVARKPKCVARVIRLLVEINIHRMGDLSFARVVKLILVCFLCYCEHVPRTWRL